MGGLDPLFRRLPAIEVMAARGRETLRFGPMKPVGLTDPNTGRRSMRWSSCARTMPGTLFNIVGFQTKLKYAEQVRIFRMIPGWSRPSSRGWAGCIAYLPQTARGCWTRGCG